MKIFILLLLTGLSVTSCVKPSAPQLRLATFNIRYDNPEDSLNNWKYRKDSIYTFIRKTNPEIINMQEVLHNQLQDLQADLPEYSFVGVGRDDGKTAGEYAPVFFKTDKFTLSDEGTFWLSEYPDSAGLKGWDAACTRIATWAKLQEKSRGKVFLVVNTHFDHVGTEARRHSALLIISKIKEIAGDTPAILTGDFNVSEQWEAYQTITTNEFVLKDAYKIAEKRTGVSYTFHDFGKVSPEKREKIDFIFVTPQIRVLTTDIPYSKIGDDLYLSDHNPEIADLEIK